MEYGESEKAVANKSRRDKDAGGRRATSCFARCCFPASPYVTKSISSVSLLLTRSRGIARQVAYVSDTDDGLMDRY